MVVGKAYRMVSVTTRRGLGARKHTACKVSDARDAEVPVESFDL